MASPFKASSSIRVAIRNCLLKKNPPPTMGRVGESLHFCTRPLHDSSTKTRSVTRDELLNTYTCRRNYQKAATAGYGEVIDCHNKLEYYRHIEDSVESKKLVVVFFMKPWCKVCCSFAPKLSEIAKKRPGVIFIKIYTHEFNFLSREYEIEEVPMFVFLKEENKVDRIVGAKIEDLEMKIDQHCAATL